MKKPKLDKGAELMRSRWSRPQATGTKKYNRAEYAEKMQLRRVAAAAQRKAEKKERRIFSRRTIAPRHFLFSRDVRRNAARLQTYIMGPRSKLPLATKIELLRQYIPSDAPFMAVNNPEARIRFHMVWSHHVRTWAQQPDSEMRCFFVTLVPKKFAIPQSLAPDFNTFELIQWASEVMRGFNFIGIVEPARYRNAGVNGSEVISFHVHLIVFEPDEAALKIRMEELNSKYEALTTGRKVALQKAITPGTLGTVIEYMSKESTMEYSVYEKPGASGDLLELDLGHRSDDEPVGPDLYQSKRPGYPKAQLKVHAAMKGRHFDELLFAGGNCKQLRDDIRRDLLADLPWSKCSGREAEFSGCFEGRPQLRYHQNPWVRAAAGYHHSDFDEVTIRARLFGNPESEEFAQEQARQRELTDEVELNELDA